MSVVQALNKATTNVQNRHFDGLTCPQSIYANTRGLSLLAETDQWFKGVQVMLEKLKKQAEMKEQGSEWSAEDWTGLASQVESQV